MDKKQQTELLAINSEFAVIVAEVIEAERVGAPSTTGGALRKVARLFDPAALYGHATVSMRLGGDTDTEAVTADDIARSIRMTAAKIRAGDRTFILESLIGKAAWLAAMAQRLSAYVATLSDPREKAALGHVLLKMEATAAKILASVAGLSYLESPRRPL